MKVLKLFYFSIRKAENKKENFLNYSVQGILLL